MSEKKQKIGAGHAKAMIRTGFKEAGQAIPAFPSQGIQPVEEAGLFGNLTPQEVAKDKGAYEAVLGKYDSRSQKHEQRQVSGEMER